MKIAYFDCFGGLAGDMIVGAFLDAGLDLAALKPELQKLDIGEFSVSCKQTARGGITGTKFDVEVQGHDHHHRGLSQILEIISVAKLVGKTGDTASRIFKRLAAAEAKVHGCDIEEIHFHEVGAVDSIVDIVSAAVAIELLGIDRIACSPIPIGSGTVKCAHGIIPLPAPATVELLVNAQTFPALNPGEATTPTGAAVMTTLSESFATPPEMKIASIGYGAGLRDDENAPNLLRVIIGHDCEDGEADSVVELSANIDDCTGELLGAAMDKLLAAGALDVWITPGYTKKSRPTSVLSALCKPGDVEHMRQIIFVETTTFGIRQRSCGRVKLAREFARVETAFGRVRVKVGRLEGEIVTVSPEFADCKTAAESHGVNIQSVMDAAKSAWANGAF
ncbi:MAG: nickel pincer cofactor biosynthesis protein LarC [Phycisphaerae bacterium]|nr:nickel pincer cofactor biosynthesis protein LarC [Phycisphaerae bacterium]